MNDDPVPISALQHWSYCPRQCALIHVEQEFTENVHTLRGQAVHARVDRPEIEELPGRRVERAMPLWSEQFELIGKADMVEFLPDGTPYPVEYKHGPRRKRLHDELQLAAQALCLEEMFARPVPTGAIFHASSRRRREVAIDGELRGATIAAIAAVHDLLASDRLPPPVNDARCRQCSLIGTCQPELSDLADQWRDQSQCLFDEQGQ